MPGGEAKLKDEGERKRTACCVLTGETYLIATQTIFK